MSQKEKIERIKRNCRQEIYQKYFESDLVDVLLNIAESLAIIADDKTRRKKDV